MEIKVTGLDRLINKLKAYQKSLEEKQHRLLEELDAISMRCKVNMSLPNSM